MAAEQDEQARFFVEMWAEAVIRQLARVREGHKKYAADQWAYYGDDEDSPTAEDMAHNFRTQWAEEHMLIWASHQLERWIKRLAIERGQTPSPDDEVLTNVRNALEHLDEADLIDGYAVPGFLGSNRSLRELPDGRLSIALGIGRIGGGFLTVEELERRALAIVRKIENEDYEKEMGQIEMWLIDEMRGK
jgi:hypothetical protein